MSACNIFCNMLLVWGIHTSGRCGSKSGGAIYPWTYTLAVVRVRPGPLLSFPLDSRASERISQDPAASPANPEHPGYILAPVPSMSTGRPLTHEPNSSHTLTLYAWRTPPSTCGVFLPPDRGSSDLLPSSDFPHLQVSLYYHRPHKSASHCSSCWSQLWFLFLSLIFHIPYLPQPVNSTIT